MFCLEDCNILLISLQQFPAAADPLLIDYSQGLARVKPHIERLYGQSASGMPIV